MAKKLEGGGLS